MATESSVTGSIEATVSGWKTACEVLTSYSALKWSNGSRQALHTHSDLHAVDPNRVSSRVSSDPHCGHLNDRVSETVPPDRVGDGGAMPNSSSFRRPASVIQSVVQAGARTRSTCTSVMPASANAATTSLRIAS